MTNNQSITFAENINQHPKHSNTPSLEQVLIIDHVAMLLQFLKSGTNPQDDNETGVEDKDIIARINGLLELLKCYGRYGEC